MDLATNGVIVTDAIKFVQTKKEKLMSKDNDNKESNEPDYDEDKDQLEEEQQDNLRAHRERNYKSSFLIPR